MYNCEIAHNTLRLTDMRMRTMIITFEWRWGCVCVCLCYAYDKDTHKSSSSNSRQEEEWTLSHQFNQWPPFCRIQEGRTKLHTMHEWIEHMRLICPPFHTVRMCLFCAVGRGCRHLSLHTHMHIHGCNGAAWLGYTTCYTQCGTIFNDTVRMYKCTFCLRIIYFCIIICKLMFRTSAFHESGIAMCAAPVQQYFSKSEDFGSTRDYLEDKFHVYSSSLAVVNENNIAWVSHRHVFG